MLDAHVHGSGACCQVPDEKVSFEPCDEEWWVDLGNVKWRLLSWPPEIEEKSPPDKDTKTPGGSNTKPGGKKPAKPAGGGKTPPLNRVGQGKKAPGKDEEEDEDPDERRMRLFYKDTTTTGPSAGSEVPVGTWLHIYDTGPKKTGSKKKAASKGAEQDASDWYPYYVSHVEAGADSRYQRAKIKHEVVVLDGVAALQGIDTTRSLFLHDTVWRKIIRGPAVSKPIRGAAVMIRFEFELGHEALAEFQLHDMQEQWWDAEVVDFEEDGGNFKGGGARGTVVGGHKSGVSYHKVRFLGLVRAACSLFRPPVFLLLHDVCFFGARGIADRRQDV